MGLGHSPQIVTNGLVLAFDIGNGLKNATGNISTNLIQNGNFVNGSGSPQEADSNPTNTIVQLANPGDSPYVLRQNGVYTEYQLNIYSGMVANTTYVMSGWYAKSSDYNGQDLMFHARTYSSSGAHIATGNDAGTLIYSTVVNGITWEYRYQTIATPSDFNNNFNWYVGYGQPGSHNGYRYYTNLKLEKGTYPSIYNLLGTGSNGECVNGLSYNSSNGGSLSFDGTNDYIDVNSNFGTVSQYTISFWARRDAENRMLVCSRGNTNFYWYGDNSWRYVHSGGGGEYYYAKPTSIPLGTWGNYVVTYDGSAVKIYRQGVYQGQQSTTGTADFSSGFTFGNFNNNGGYYFSGLASLFQIYNKALTAAEIQQNYNALKSRFGLT